MKDCCEYREINRWIPSFIGFTEFTSSIPKLYWNVKSQEQRILALCKQLHKLICYSDMLADHIEIDHADIVELQELFEQFQESGFEEYYEQQIQAWIDAHMADIITQAVKMVFFGLNDDGYFVAYIPDSWNEIVFDTGYDYSDQNTYGRLILEMYVTDTFQINGKPTNLIWEVQNG